MQFKQPGPWLFAVGIVGISIDGLLSSLSPGQLPELSLTWQPLCAIAVALCLPFGRTRAVAGGIIALFSLVTLVEGIPHLARWPGNLSGWVGAAQNLAFAALGLAFVRPEVWRVARVMFGIAVVVFGGAQVLNPELHASYLPDWFPLREIWPYLTGFIQIAAGAMIMIGFRASTAAFGVGLMWLSWIPIVHLSPAFDSTGDSYERYLMLTLLALAGAAWSVGERVAPKAGGDLPSRSH